MLHKLINEGTERTHVLIMESGDEAVSCMQRFCEENGVHAARFTAIGALSDLTLGYFDWQTKEYEKIPLHEQVEVLTLAGDVALQDGLPKIHAHIVVGKRDGSAHGGHLLEGHVRPTLEVMLIESPKHLARTMRPELGIALIDIEVSGTD